MRRVRRLLFYTLCARVVYHRVLLYRMRTFARFEYFIVFLARVTVVLTLRPDDVRGQEPEELDCSPISRT